MIKNIASKWIQPFSKFPGFARLCAVQSAYFISTEMFAFVTPFIVGSLQGSASWMGIIYTAKFLPRALFGSAAGHWVDRSSSKNVFLTSLGMRVLIYTLLAALGWWGQLGLVWYAIILFLAGIFEVGHNVSANSYVPGVVNRSGLTWANSVLGVIFALCVGFIATPVGGYVAEIIGNFGVIFLYALVLLAIIPLVLSMPNVQTGNKKESPPIKDALLWLKSGENGNARTLIWSVGSALLILMTSYVVNAHFGYYCAVVLDMKPHVVGLVFLAAGAGQMAGALIFPGLAKRFSLHVLLLVFSVLLTAGLFLLSSATTFFGLAAGLFLSMGLCQRVLLILGTSLYQALVPKELMGSFSGLFYTVDYVAFVCASLFGGFIAQGAGHSFLFAGSGAVGLALTLGCALSLARSGSRISLEERISAA